MLKTIALLFHYNGTPTPIVKKPKKAFMSEEVIILSLTNAYMIVNTSKSSLSSISNFQMRDGVRDIVLAFSTSVVMKRGCDKVITY